MIDVSDEQLNAVRLLGRTKLTAVIEPITRQQLIDLGLLFRPDEKRLDFSCTGRQLFKMLAADDELSSVDVE